MDSKTSNLNMAAAAAPFYSKDYRPHDPGQAAAADAGRDGCDIHNPVEINGYLSRFVYKQEDYVRSLSMFLYNHVSGRPTVMLVSGPPGNGKSYAAGLIRGIYPDTLLWDASGMSEDAFRGRNKVSDILRAASGMKRPVVVLDEFDKLCRPSYSSKDSNISISVQSEFLKILEGGSVMIGEKESTKKAVDTSGYSWLLIGSFNEKAESLAAGESSKGLGFGSVRKEPEPYGRPLGIKDLMDYGMMPEIASRVTRICSTRPLSREDFRYLIADHWNSPVKEVEASYGISLGLTEDEVSRMADECYGSGLGIRNVRSRLMERADDIVYGMFEARIPGRAACRGEAEEAVCPEEEGEYGAGSACPPAPDDRDSAGGRG